ncbi:uncharacterized protein BO96DRAFT_222350 [Aspergillus niger CBS 101883]|uniref:uncharacterized protein n=1 Tax=Aspergillus lacticoffeatus (strain CBS 101883) TaxID=1450533 RepID=UPI000D7FEEC1|nr:uncharacterized protein BO96DRAFT_222350 [Aspergillus niger CBS 101883]PYH50578.1 hypothetical protein BO96DRAFT_222350 [Aspergillus niger CBS 101883]
MEEMKGYHACIPLAYIILLHFILCHSTSAIMLRTVLSDTCPTSIATTCLALLLPPTPMPASLFISFISFPCII